MQISIFSLPLYPTAEQQEELNHFLRSHKIVEVRKELTTDSGVSVWSFCVTYLGDIRQVDEQKKEMVDKSRRTDYKDILEPLEFERFAKMRKLRKQIADSEAIPAYAVFTDAELAELAKIKSLTNAEIMKVQGIGKKKVEKYGAAFCNIDNMDFDEKSGISD